MGWAGRLSLTYRSEPWHDGVRLESLPPENRLRFTLAPGAEMIGLDRNFHIGASSRSFRTAPGAASRFSAYRASGGEVPEVY